MISHKLKKWAGALALIGIFMFAGTVLFQLQVAFGWTNPTAPPPTGAGVLGVTNGQAWLGPIGTTPSGTVAFTINGALSVLNNVISDVNAPIGDKDAVNKGFLLAQTGGVTTGAGSVVLYYKTTQIGSGPVTGTAPSCPTGWTYQQSGYGPHYIGVISYDYLNGGTGGTGGGFGSAAPDTTATPPPPPPGNGGTGSTLPAGYTYTTTDISFGSDSVCSQSQKSVVPVNQYYQNAFTNNGATWYADACSAVTNTTTGITTTECNLCVICAKP
jgi:hypothetical protein